MNSSQITASTKQIHKNLGDGYLKFDLNRHTSALLSMKHTQEAIIVPFEAVTSMPSMPTCILGLMNWRSRIIWAIDLPRMLNLENLDYRLRQYNVVVIRVESLLLGLVVQDIKGTAKFMPDEISSPMDQIASSLVPYLRGCVIQEKEILLVLDAQAIVQSSILRSD